MVTLCGIHLRRLVVGFTGLIAFGQAESLDLRIVPQIKILITLTGIVMTHGIVITISF